MESIKKIIVDELEENHPAREHGYKYNVRIFTSIDGGKKFYYWRGAVLQELAGNL